MNAMVSSLPNSGGALATSRDMDAVRSAMKSSLYPGATDESVEMVLAYCRASGLDPMTKPVHLVPMSVTVGKDQGGRAIKEMRDVVMPGIGLYRINAARTDAYAGCSEPEFGPMRTMNVTKDEWSGPQNNRTKKTVPAGTFEYPEWCRITVTRIVEGIAREFSAKEYWIENYATAGNDTDTPNSMWKKRPFGQLAKCTEAQALRKAFPEAVGSQPTADEMEGKGHYIDAEVVQVEPRATDSVVSMPKAKTAPAITQESSAGKEQATQAEPAAAAKPAAKPAAETVAKPAAEPAAEPAAAPAPGINVPEGQKRMLLVKAKQAGLFTEEELLAKFPAIDSTNLNTVLADLRKIQDANDGAN